MAHPTISSLTLPKVALLLGVDASWAWREAKRGAYGPLTRAPHGRGAKRGWVLVSIRELEARKGRVYTPEQIETAAGTVTLTKARQSADAAKAKARARRAPLAISAAPEVVSNSTKAAIDRAVRARDAVWRFWRLAPALQIQFPDGPPLAVRSSDEIAFLYSLIRDKENAQ